MNELETLLNSLIKMGWKPWGKDVDKITIPPKEQFGEDRNLFIDIKFSNGFGTYRSRRELVSRDSQLWEFCAEKGLLKQLGDKRSIGHGDKYYSSWEPNEYGYRLIKSALVPEEPEFEYGEEIEVSNDNSNRIRRMFIAKSNNGSYIGIDCSEERNLVRGLAYTVSFYNYARKLRPQLTRKEIAEKFGVSEDFTLVD